MKKEYQQPEMVCVELLTEEVALAPDTSIGAGDNPFDF